MITNEYLYFKFGGYFERVPIANIHCVKMCSWFDENIEFILQNKKSVSIWGYEVFHKVKAMIDILRTDYEVKIEAQPLQIQFRI